MTWIKALFQRMFGMKLTKRLNNPQKFILLISLPCLFITSFALLATPLSGYLVAFIIIVLMLIMSYAFVAAKQNYDFQIRTLSNLIESMIDGDYSLRGRLQTNQAFQELFSLINDLSDTLAKHKIEAQESRLLLERIMEQMDAMVLATDEQGVVVLANASARKLILQCDEELEHVSLASTSIGAELLAAESGIVEFSQPLLSGEHLLVKESFLSQGQRHQLYLLTNAERLLMEKERKAWQSLIRVLSHEINNSLTPIAAISQSMQHSLQQPDTRLEQSMLLEGVNIINERAESLNRFITSYSELSHLPKPNKSLVRLSAMLSRLTPLYPQCQIAMDEGCDLTLEVDSNQFEQVLINLFKNASEAMQGQTQKAIELVTIQDGHSQHIEIKDHGTGAANLSNLFVPFYTTKQQGSGIGLTLCRQILFNHNGLISLTNREDCSGLTVRLTLPAPLN